MNVPKLLLDAYLKEGVGNAYTGVTVHIRYQGDVVYEQSAGYVHPEVTPEPVTRETLFDLASLTKLFTTTLVLYLISQGHLSLHTRVREVLPTFTGERPIAPYEDPLHPGRWIRIPTREHTTRAEQVTIWHLLTHTSGLPAWHPLYRLPPEQRRGSIFHVPFAYAPGEHVVYSDLGMMLLGEIITTLMGTDLAQALHRHLLHPLGLTSIHYRPPSSALDGLSIAATERCPWRKRRLWGEVHDENAWALGGIAGHAGLFGAARDVGRFGQAWLDALHGHGPLSFLDAYAAEAIHPQAEEGHIRRGLGWSLWSPSPTSPSYPLGPKTFGHTGFTGTSLYIEPSHSLVIVALTNRVYYGRNGEPIQRWRWRLHQLIREHLLST